MRLRWYDRILVALSGVVLAVLGAGVILCGCGVIRLPQGIALDLWTGQDWKWLPVIFLGGLLLFVWGVHLIVRPLCPKRDLHGRYFTVKTNGEDTLSISVSALDQLVRKCLDAHPEVLTSRISIGGQERAMRLVIRVTLRSGVRIPQIVTQLQEQIKQYVSTCSGVTVEQVSVIVEATKNPEALKEGESVKLLEPVADAPQAPTAEETACQEAEQVPAEPQEEPAEETTAEVAEEPPVQTAEPSTAPEETAETSPELTQQEIYAQREAAEMGAFTVDFGPKDPLPVELSADAFPFPSKNEETPSQEEEKNA